MNTLEAEKVTKTYAKHTALQDVSISVPQGSVFGLLGPNGAGKTSLIRIINQITGPDSGRILFEGEPLRPEHVHRIGYLPEERGLYKKMKVGEQCIYLARLKGLSEREAKARLKAWFDRFDISAWWDKKVEELSKGMAQKVQFVTTVMHEPKFIILDEPFSGFDPINAALIRKEILRLRDEGATVMLSTHNMTSVEEVCSHIALINHSKVILDGEVSEVRNRFKESVYEIEFAGQMLAFTNALWTGYELISHQEAGDELRMATVRLKRDATVNDLLSAVMPHVQVQSVREVIPRMDDIFIKVVQQKNPEDE
ncbi:MAG: ABC transporter ATP-binding protein [Cryomorphaceae bacterium]|nr:ATP-binding cassette domain-containing protein [Flavobacteriales bacterium]